LGSKFAIALFLAASCDCVSKGERLDEGRRGDAFKLEQPFLRGQTAAKARKRAIRADHTVTGHDDGERVLAIGKTNGARSLWIADGTRNIGIAARLAIGNAGKLAPDTKLERRADRREGDIPELFFLACEISLKRLQGGGEMSACDLAPVPLRENDILLIREENGCKPCLCCSEAQFADGCVERCGCKCRIIGKFHWSSSSSSPEGKGSIAAPGPPVFGQGFERLRVYRCAVPGRLAQAAIGCRKGIRLAQRTQRNVMRGPGANAGKRGEVFNCRLKALARREVDLAGCDGSGKRLQRGNAPAGKAEAGQVAARKRLCAREIMSEAFFVGGQCLAESGNDPSRDGGRPIHGNLLTEHRAHREFETVKGSGHPKTRHTLEARPDEPIA